MQFADQKYMTWADVVGAVTDDAPAQVSADLYVGAGDIVVRLPDRSMFEVAMAMVSDDGSAFHLVLCAEETVLVELSLFRRDFLSASLTDLGDGANVMTVQQRNGLSVALERKPVRA